MRIIRSSEHKIIPWRNGQGMTREVARSTGPQEDSFDWRISIATVDRSGPFSVFPDIERTIAVLSGDGFMLHVGDEAVPLSQQSPPYTFAGELKAEAVVSAGPSTDLNIMTRRNVFTHAMKRLFPGTIEIAHENASITVLLTTATMTVVADSEQHSFGPLDAALFEGSKQEIAITLPAGSTAFCIAIRSA